MTAEDVAVGIIAVLLIAIVLAVSVALDRKRKGELAALAPSLGLTFSGDAFSDAEQRADLTMPLFRTGRLPRFHNVMSGVDGEARVSVFEFGYTTGAGNTVHNTVQTVAAFTHPARRIPTFDAAPKGIVQKLDEAIAHRGIAFPAEPDFARRYVVRGDDEAATRALFTPEVIASFSACPASEVMHVAGTGRTVVVYRSGKRTKPASLGAFIETAGSLAHPMFAAAPERDAP